MAFDLNLCRQLIEEQVGMVADENYQRRVWFGGGPEMDWPEERICSYFGSAVEEFLLLKDNGLNVEQQESLQKLTQLMIAVTKKPEKWLLPTFIDDPSWQEIIKVAKETNELLKPQLPHYTWSNRNRKTTTTVGGSLAAAYLYDTDGSLIAEANGTTGATTREYIWTDGLLLTQVEPNNILAYTMDRSSQHAHQTMKVSIAGNR